MIRLDDQVFDLRTARRIGRVTSYTSDRVYFTDSEIMNDPDIDRRILNLMVEYGEWVLVR